jgi:hypothetical protein
MENLVPIKSVDIEGETIRRVLFVKVGGGDKMIMVFESRRVLVLPVYRNCPVQSGTMTDLAADFPEFIENLEAERTLAIAEADKTINLIKEMMT